MSGTYPGAVDQRLLEAIRGRLLSRGGGRLDEGELVAELQAAAAATGTVLGVGDVLEMSRRVRARLWGLGPLEPLLADPDVTDVLVNGAGRVHVDRGRGLEPVRVDVGLEEDVRALAVRLAAEAGRRLDEAAPWVDARLPGGIRLHAVIPPLAPDGTHISLRVLRQGTFDLPGFAGSGSLPPAWIPVLEAVIARRAAYLISGGTGAGKTTLLAALLSRVPAAERILLVEDVSELLPRHPHVVRLEARHANVEGRGAVTLQDLVRQALRMRPDRLVVGECRGAEVRDLLAALNTGHAGGCGTLHANAAADVMARLEALGSLAGMSPEAIAAQAIAALDVVIHLRRARDGRRRVDEIAVLTSRGRDDVRVTTALLADPLDPAHPGRPGPGWPRLAERLALPDVWPPP